MRKYVFVVGGVMSGVGKGVAASSIGRLLKDSGYQVTAFKIDPYINVDAGTMNPTEHGEVFVLDDGTECDQDMGNYERFLGTTLSGANYMTTGSVYLSVITRERNLEYKGKCVEVVPHIPLAVIERINDSLKESHSEVAVVEIGGTVGEYQNILFLEAVRILKLKYPKDVALVLVSYLPLLNKDNELKTKPTQYAVHTLNAAGLQPDMILGRAAHPLDKKRKEKIAFNCNVSADRIISAPDISSIYEVPINFKKEKVDDKTLKLLSLKKRRDLFDKWNRIFSPARRMQDEIVVGMVGKYFTSGSFVLADSYISVIEALKHAAHFLGKNLKIEWVDASDFDPVYAGKEYVKNLSNLKKYAGIVVPGGFGGRAVEGIINAISYARKNKIPYLGLCYGMQLAVVEFARNIVGLKGANTTEINANTLFPVVDVMPDQKERLAKRDYGGTMRLGKYPAVIGAGTTASYAYLKSGRFIIKKSGSTITISERHRHRYEINPDYLDALKKGGLVFSGMSPSGKLAEIIELPKNVHPFFVATQFHPEFKSWPTDPHPLFREFIRVAEKNIIHNG